VGQPRPSRKSIVALMFSSGAAARERIVQSLKAVPEVMSCRRQPCPPTATIPLGAKPWSVK
jgi:hypothetical protein